MFEIVPRYFYPPDVDNTKSIKAILEVARDGEALSVGAVVWGNSMKSGAWVSGYASTEDFMRAEMVQLLLSRCTEDLPLVVYTKGFRDLLPKVAMSEGMTKAGKPFKGYAALKPIQLAMDRGDWTLEPPEPVAYGLQSARAVARLGLPLALKERFAFPSHKQKHPDWLVIASSFGEAASG